MIVASGNDIPRLQEESGSLTLLRARQHLYSVAQYMQIFQLVFVVIIPIILGIVGILWEAARPFVAILSLFITVIDVVFLDRMLWKRLHSAANVSEQFDCEILSIPWKETIAGRRTDPELISSSARAWAGDIAVLRGWYPAIVGCAPLEVARFACQRTNLWYDAELRHRYATAIAFVGFAFVLGLTIFGAAVNLTFIDFVVTVLTPSVPMLIWILREQFRQRDAARKNEDLKDWAERMIEAAATGHASRELCDARSRDLQDAIFLRRSGNPLILPPFYKFSRSKMERDMNEGALRLLRRAGIDPENSKP